MSVGSLAHRDLDGLLRFLRGLGDPVDEERFAQAVLVGLRELIAYDGAGYNDLDLAAGAVRWVAVPSEVGDAADRGAFERNMHQHPVVAAFVQTGDGRAMKVWDYLRPREFHALALYNDFYRPLAFEHQLIVEWIAGKDRLLAISLFRSRQDFSERDRRLLDLVRPYVVLAQRNVQARMRTQAILSAFEHSRTLGAQGVVLTRGEAGVELLVGEAERLLASFFTSEHADDLPEELVRWIRTQRARLNGVHDVPRDAWALVKDGEVGRLEVEFVPGSSRDGLDALLLSLRPRQSRTDAGMRALGLTRREAEVLSLVASGKSDAAIADELYVHTDTVKKHLQRVYRKLDVHSRTAAVAKVLDAA